MSISKQDKRAYALSKKVTDFINWVGLKQIELASYEASLVKMADKAGASSHKWDKVEAKKSEVVSWMAGRERKALRKRTSIMRDIFKIEATATRNSFGETSLAAAEAAREVMDEFTTVFETDAPSVEDELDAKRQQKVS